MKRHIPSLHALRAFEATARLLSFQQAAKELNVTHSAVSHQIKKLEEDLGQPLFQRLGRSIALTEVGAAYVVEIREALNMIESSSYRIFGDPDKGDLSVQVYMGIASRWLVQRLGDFRDQYPDINIALYSSYFDWEFEPNAADIGIVYCESTAPGLMYQQLFKGMLIPVCSPNLIADNPDLTVMDLIKKPFLRIKESPDNLPEWLKPLGLDESNVNVVSERDNHQLALEAAIAGHGVAIVQSFFASGDIAGNRLVVPVDMKVPEIGAWYLVRTSRTSSDMKVNYFSNWLYRQVMADKALLRAG